MSDLQINSNAKNALADSKPKSRQIHKFQKEPYANFANTALRLKLTHSNLCATLGFFPYSYIGWQKAGLMPASAAKLCKAMIKEAETKAEAKIGAKAQTAPEAKTAKPSEKPDSRINSNFAAASDAILILRVPQSGHEWELLTRLAESLGISFTVL